MTYVVGAITGAKFLYGASQAGKNKKNVEKAKVAAGKIKEQRLDIVKDQLETQRLAGTSAWESSMRRFDIGTQDVLTSTRGGIRDIKESTDVAYSQSGLVTSGTIERKGKIQTEGIMDKYKSDIAKLLDTKMQADVQKDITIAQSGLEYRKGRMSAEEAYQNMITAAEAGGSGNWFEAGLEAAIG